MYLFLIRDGKQLDDGRSALFPFILMIIFGLPLLILLIPFVIISSCCKSKKTTSIPSYVIPTKEESNVKPLTERQYDVVMFGATGHNHHISLSLSCSHSSLIYVSLTGYTGRLCARYLAEHSSKTETNLKWAIAGT